ncbi:MAG: signal peptide peptidase SppA [Candidatus Nanosalina sp.]
MKTKIVAVAVAFLLLISSSAALNLESIGLGKGKGAIVSLSGTIQPSSSDSLLSSGGGITPQQVRQINEKVKQGNYRAVIYEINSGGGTVVASKEIMRSIEDMKIPTVCRFRDITASGAYLFSLGCDRIVADSATITGSIGVKSSFFEFTGAMERYGVRYVNITSGKYKDISSPYQNASKREKEILEEKAEMIHEQFLNLVEEKRNVSERELQRIGTGNIFLGTEAKKLGLVDRLGGRETAFEVAENMTGSDLKFEKVETQSSSLFSMVSMNSFIQNLLGTGSVPLKAAY